MKIIELEIEGYRSFRSQTWHPGDLNVVIGPNASGKTNLLRVLDTLNAAANGSLSSLVQLEGGMESIVWDGQAQQVHLRAKTTPIPPYSDSVTDALTYDLHLGRLGRTSAYRIDHEVLGNFYRVETGSTQEPFKLLERDPHHAIVFSIGSQEFQSIPNVATTTTTPYPTHHAIEAPDASLPEDETLLSFSAGPFAANQFVAEFQQNLANWKIYHGFDTDRRAVVRAPQITRADMQVSADGQNLISVLHSLYNSSRQFKSEVNAAMRAAFGDDFDELQFPPAADQRIQMKVLWKSLTRGQPAADLSDGTLRFLFLLAVLANPTPPSLIAIDEPETGLHPSMLPIIAEFARDAATRSQVILTTHSADLLDAFGHEPPTTTVVENREGQSFLRVVAGDELSYWLNQYSLGELYRSKELEALR